MEPNCFFIFIFCLKYFWNGFIGTFLWRMNLFPLLFSPHDALLKLHEIGLDIMTILISCIHFFSLWLPSLLPRLFLFSELLFYAWREGNEYVDYTALLLHDSLLSLHFLASVVDLDYFVFLIFFGGQHMIFFSLFERLLFMFIFFLGLAACFVCVVWYVCVRECVSLSERSGRGERGREAVCVGVCACVRVGVCGLPCVSVCVCSYICEFLLMYATVTIWFWTHWIITSIQDGD